MNWYYLIWLELIRIDKELIGIGKNWYDLIRIDKNGLEMIRIGLICFEFIIID